MQPKLGLQLASTIAMQYYYTTPSKVNYPCTHIKFNAHVTRIDHTSSMIEMAEKRLLLVFTAFLSFLLTTSADNGTALSSHPYLGAAANQDSPCLVQIEGPIHTNVVLTRFVILVLR